MEDHRSEIVVERLDKDTERLFVVRWLTEYGFESLVLSNRAELEQYLLTHNLDIDKTEVLEVQVIKQFTWKKVIELLNAY